MIMAIISTFNDPLIHAFTAQNMKFSIKDFFGKCDQIRRKLRTEEILNGKLQFLFTIYK